MRNCLILAMPILAAMAVPAASELLLADGGKSEYRIVIADDAAAPERAAAKELRDYLRRATGARLEVIGESSAWPGSPRILVGPSKSVRELLPGVGWDALPADGIVIRTIGHDLVLAGGRPRGSLYAVYTYLEDVVGCRWWASDGEYVPKKSTLRVADSNISYAPSIRYREAFYRDPIKNPLFAARLKLNGHHYSVPPRFGGHYSIIGWCHTFYNWLPPDKYFSDHPDWYSEIGGKRTTAGAQLCLTNRAALEEMTKVVLEQIRANPSAGIISVSQNDWHGRCECANCKALEEREGSPAGPLIAFVNAVAEKVEAEFPEVLVETLAYQYTRKPPATVRPRKNVVVRLCTIECNFMEPLTHESNEAFFDDMRGWSAIAPNLYVWDYVTNFANYMIPHPNLRVLAPNLRFFEKNKTIGMFEQGDANCAVGDFVRLRAWLLAHLMWDPFADPKQLTREFLNGYYGAAGPYLEQYLELVHDARTRAGSRIGCYHQETGYLTFDDLQSAMRLWKSAEAAVAGDRTIVERLRRDRLTLDHVWLLRIDGLKAEAEKRGEKLEGPSDARAAAAEFLRLARAHSAGNYSEGQGFEPYAVSIEARYSEPPPSPDELARRDSDSVTIEETDFELFEEGKWSRRVDDLAASNGRAAEMPCDHTQWAVQYPVTAALAKQCPGKWRFYLVARTDALADAGGAFFYGLYDGFGHYELTRFSESIENSRDGAYRTYFLGSHDVRPGQYVWVAPMANPQQVKRVLVDRIVLVPEEK